MFKFLRKYSNTKTLEKECEEIMSKKLSKHNIKCDFDPKVKTSQEKVIKNDKKSDWFYFLEDKSILKNINYIYDDYNNQDFWNLACYSYTGKLYNTIESYRLYKKEKRILIKPIDLIKILDKYDLNIGALRECIHYIPKKIISNLKTYNNGNIVYLTINNLHHKIGLRSEICKIHSTSTILNRLDSTTYWYKHNYSKIPEYFPDESFIPTHSKTYNYFLLGKGMNMCGEDLYKEKEKTECIIFYYDDNLECFVFSDKHYWEVNYKNKAKSFDEYKKDIQKAHATQLGIDFSYTNKILEEISKISEDQTTDTSSK